MSLSAGVFTTWSFVLRWQQAANGSVVRCVPVCIYDSPHEANAAASEMRDALDDSWTVVRMSWGAVCGPALRDVYTKGPNKEDDLTVLRKWATEAAIVRCLASMIQTALGVCVAEQLAGVELMEGDYR